VRTGMRSKTLSHRKGGQSKMLKRANDADFISQTDRPLAPTIGFKGWILSLLSTPRLSPVRVHNYRNLQTILWGLIL
jgi:hypothetical protein